MEIIYITMWNVWRLFTYKKENKKNRAHSSLKWRLNMQLKLLLLHLLLFKHKYITSIRKQTEHTRMHSRKIVKTFLFMNSSK